MNQTTHTKHPKTHPKWLPNVVFGLLLTGFMTLIVSCIATVKALGLTVVMSDVPAFISVWMSAYLSSWVVAFPFVLFIAPMVRSWVNRWFD